MIEIESEARNGRFLTTVLVISAVGKSSDEGTNAVHRATLLCPPRSQRKWPTQPMVSWWNSILTSSHLLNPNSPSLAFIDQSGMGQSWDGYLSHTEYSRR